MYASAYWMPVIFMFITVSTNTLVTINHNGETDLNYQDVFITITCAAYKIYN